MSVNRRRRYFVHRGIQFSLISRMVVQCILFAVCACSLTAITQMMLDPLADRAERALQLRLTMTSIAIASVCLLPVFVWDSIKFSHRFVGPILRLHSIVKQPQVPEDRIRLRKGDFWTDLATDFNRMLERRNSSQQATGTQPSPTDGTATAERLDSYSERETAGVS